MNRVSKRLYIRMVIKPELKKETLTSKHLYWKCCIGTDGGCAVKIACQCVNWAELMQFRLPIPSTVGWSLHSFGRGLPLDMRSVALFS